MRALASLLLAACAEAPAALLPAAQPPPPATGLAVAHGAVRGFLARPPGDPGVQRPVAVWVGRELDEPTRAAAAAAAAADGAIVFVAAPEVPEQAATAYAAGVRGAGAVTVVRGRPVGGAP